MSGRHGLGDHRIPWTILLEANATRLDDTTLAAGLAALGAPAPAVGILPALRSTLAASTPDPVLVGRADDDLLVAADHARLDGLALLVALERITGTEVRSDARGITDDRPQVPVVRAGLRRLREIALTPSAVVAGSAEQTGSGTPRGAAGDVLVRAPYDARVGTAALVGAGARAVARWNASRGERGDRVSVAVGVSTVGGTGARLADDSGFLRLTGAESMPGEEIRRALSTAPLQPGGDVAGGAGGRLVAVASRLLADRLGSTLLVSHLGTVTTTAAADLAFYPVTGGASGLALGAVTIGAHTTLTLRGRAGTHDEDGLRALLESVLEALDESR